MIIGGYNKDFRLIQDSTTKNKEGCAYINPPCTTILDISLILSFSACADHTIWITKEGKCFCVGNNEYGQIIGTLNKEIIRKEHLIKLEDKNGLPCQFISAVCGKLYTLYLFSSSSQTHNQVSYSESFQNFGTPIFVNINGHNPIHLFGGFYTAAIVDTEGSIFIITEESMMAGLKNIEASFLPEKEKPVSIACCSSFIIAVGTSGRVFCSNISYHDKIEGKVTFSVVEELEGIEIIQVSGIFEHCLAVSKDGRVFVHGINYYGRLGLDGDIIETKKFTEITSLSKYKIISASAGYNHSLFITSDGKVLACGSNKFGELLLNKPSENCIFSPIETTITSGASFGIAGVGISTVFVNCEPPKNTPNTPFKYEE